MLVWGSLTNYVSHLLVPLHVVTVNTSVHVQVFTVTSTLFVDHSYIRSFMAALLFLMHHLRDVSFPQI